MSDLYEQEEIELLDIGAFKEIVSDIDSVLSKLEEKEPPDGWENTYRYESMKEILKDNIPISLLEVLVKEKKEEARKLRQEVARLLDDAGLENATLDNGRKVSKKEYLSAKILDFFKAKMFLIDEGYESKIKTSLDFPSGEYDDELQEVLKAGGYSYKEKQTVHPQSLKAIVKNLLSEGKILPEAIDYKIYTEGVIK